MTRRRSILKAYITPYLADSLDLEWVTNNTDFAHKMDAVLLVIGVISYFLLVWLPVLFTLIHLTCCRPTDDEMGATDKMTKRWRRYHRQYNYLEIWFRTHVIVFICVIIADIWEDSHASYWSGIFRIIFFFVSFFVCIILGITTRILRKRVHKIKEQISFENVFQSDRMKLYRQTSFNQKIFSTFYKKFNITNNELLQPMMNSSQSDLNDIDDNGYDNDEYSKVSRLLEVASRPTTARGGRAEDILFGPITPMSDTNYSQWTENRNKRPKSGRKYKNNKSNYNNDNGYRGPHGLTKIDTGHGHGDNDDIGYIPLQDVNSGNNNNNDKSRKQSMARPGNSVATYKAVRNIEDLTEERIDLYFERKKKESRFEQWTNEQFEKKIKKLQKERAKQAKKYKKYQQKTGFAVENSHSGKHGGKHGGGTSQYTGNNYDTKQKKQQSNSKTKSKKGKEKKAKKGKGKGYSYRFKHKDNRDDRDDRDETLTLLSHDVEHAY